MYSSPVQVLQCASKRAQYAGDRPRFQVGGNFVFFWGGGGEGQLHVVIFGWAATIAEGQNCSEILYRNV